MNKTRNHFKIENFLSKVNIRQLLLETWGICDLTNINAVEKNIIDNLEKIKFEWLIWDDFRFSQITMGYLSKAMNNINKSGDWYYYDDDEILKRQGYKPRDYCMWGSIYDENGNELEYTKYRLVCDLEISHMQKLLNDGWVSEGSFMYKVISDELRMRLRKEKLKRLSDV